MSKLSRAGVTTLGLAVVVALAALALADWSPGDGHKMHFPQLPDEAGWDVNATQPLILADDWQCSETGWVKDVHFWGSWKHGVEGQVISFVLSIHEDIPADQSPTGYSMPGQTLWEQEITNFTAVPIDPPSMEGWYDPSNNEIIWEDHQAYFQYNVFLPEAMWFWQEAGTIYWLNISAIVEDPANTQWGWKSTLDHWNDDAVWATWGDLNWIDMWEPEMPLHNDFWVTFDPLGNFVSGGGLDPFGQGWYEYPSGWWNIWFYDHPFDPERKKEIHLEFDVFPLEPGENYVEVAINWSTPEWSATGNPDPPIPPTDEAVNIGRHVVLAQANADGHYIFDYELPDFNPEWVSVDVRGFNFVIPEGGPNFIDHTCIGSLDLSFVITGDPGETDTTCDFYKSRYLDYAPQGMPDFDQKQLNWIDGNQKWSHDGPAALANCMWWFDSKFEPNPVDPRPFGTVPPNDGYPLVQAYGPWDDHDPANVQPFITDLANNWVNTNPGGFSGTQPWDLQIGFRNWLNFWGLSHLYRDTIVLQPTFEYIKAQVLDCQDVILLLSFWEDQGTHSTYIGSHYVTVAGVCTDPDIRQLCISDPYLDFLEGEPPAGSVHGGTVHNDADNISGPHAQINHDPYQCQLVTPPGWVSPVEVVNYPTTGPLLANFTGMNYNLDWTPWGGGTVYTTINQALVICPDTAMPDTCEYYKLGYEDFCPFGMPDFDQKQNSWINAASGQWSHCGPVALANCFWWFDSKFEPNPVDPRPFYPGPGNPAANDNYPLVPSFSAAGGWDDHDTLNVMPFVDSLALYCQTNSTGSGTNVFDLATGAQNWLNKVGLGSKYTIQVVPLDPAFPYEYIRDQVLESQDVILLIGFWEEISADVCERVGGHYVTVAGTCPDQVDSAFCISDPYFDKNEGEPPAGSAHGSSVHNDASLVSGPHGTNHHDRYDVITPSCQNFTGAPPFTMELAGYPVNPTNVQAFQGQNTFDPALGMITPQGNQIHAILEFAVIICPAPLDTVKCELQGGANPVHPPTYWYDVTPGAPGGLFDFHVHTIDSVAGNYSNWVSPAGWNSIVHKVGTQWWVSWWDPTGTNPITSPFRFQFDNSGISVWSDWVTTNSGTSDPTNLPNDSAANHTLESNGYGYLVHVPRQIEDEPDTCDFYKAPWEDYAPSGMPDFDQKQDAWVVPGSPLWSHCGPVALANCLWWFDSKYEKNPLDPRPFYPGPGTPPKNDSYRMVESYDPAGIWDDHDTMNVMPLVDSLAFYCQTNILQPGTNINDMIAGVQQWMTNRGLLSDYIINPIPGDAVDYPFIFGEVQRSEDLILLLGFWEIIPTGGCRRIGGHYVTTAGVCNQEEAICISDPYFDANEGEPPAGSAHAAGVHNDALNVSGPHATMHHDKYNVQLGGICHPWLEVVGYPINPTNVQNFLMQNPGTFSNEPYTGGQLVTMIEFVLDISPCCDVRGDADNNGSINVSDLTYLVNYLFKGGPPPPCPPEGDVDDNGSINVSDLTYLVNYLFKGGPPPIPCP